MIYAIVSIIALALLSIAVYLIRREGTLGERIYYSDKLIKSMKNVNKIDKELDSMSTDALIDKLRNKDS